jgi:hypothetical protein
VRISLFDRKELVLMNRFRLLATLLFIFAAVFQGHPAQAQIQTYFYQGPPWSLSQCEYYGGGSAPPCTDGNIFGSLTVWGVPDNYTGDVSSNIATWTLSATSIGSVNSGQSTSNAPTFGLTNGQMTAWYWPSYLANGTGWTSIYTDSSGYDQAIAWDTGTGASTNKALFFPRRWASGLAPSP